MCVCVLEQKLYSNSSSIIKIEGEEEWCIIFAFFIIATQLRVFEERKREREKQKFIQENSKSNLFMCIYNFISYYYLILYYI